jgi:deoxyribodipyrimidine photo-lyase
MVATRRPHFNFALDRAADLALELKRPLVVLEALRCDYRWASDRHHAFVVQGMADNRVAFEKTEAFYYPYVEPQLGAGRGLLAALAKRAGAVVTDDYPAFFLPRMLTAAAAKLDVRLEAVDSNGLWPMRATLRSFPVAHGFRRHLQRELAPHLVVTPRPHLPRGLAPLRPAALREETRRWPLATDDALTGSRASLARLPLDHGIAPAPIRGGHVAARSRLRAFMSTGLARYAEDRNDPDRDGGSGFSPYLHFGHLSGHEVFAAIAKAEGWTPSKLGKKAHGKREGWWGMSAPTEAFLDELVTWREVGFNFAANREDLDRWDSLPTWARATLDKHARDPRPRLYTLAQLDRAETYDELWNAAQRQLVGEGRIHNYLRMLWGKKVLEWSPSPREALERLLELNNRYALDGRDPNSSSGIFWIFGRYDRAWGPERPIFGTIRYMSSENTARKLDVREYLTRYAK